MDGGTVTVPRGYGQFHGQLLFLSLSVAPYFEPWFIFCWNISQFNFDPWMVLSILRYSSILLPDLPVLSGGSSWNLNDFLTFLSLEFEHLLVSFFLLDVPFGLFLSDSSELTLISMFDLGPCLEGTDLKCLNLTYRIYLMRGEFLWAIIQTLWDGA